MKIGIDVTSAVNQTAGIGRYTRELVRELIRLDAEDDFFLHSFYGDTRVLEERLGDRRLSVTSYDLNGRALRLYALALSYAGLTPEHLLKPVDLFHVPDFSYPAPRKVPSVLTINDLIFMVHPEHFTWVNRTFMNRMAAFSAGNARKIIAISESTKRDVVDLLGIPEEKIAVVYNGLGDQFAPAAPEIVGETTARLGITGPYVLYTGTLEPRKNIPVLIEAFNLCCRRAPELTHRLVIAGKKGWLYEDIFRRVHELDLAERVVFTGYVADEDLVALYSGADLFVFPSVYEGFGFPIIEAMACEAPVICSSSSSLPEVAGDAALFFTPNDHERLADLILQVLGDAALRRGLIEKGKKNAARFPWSKTAAETLALYKSVV
ncbi:MAG: glycosyltransferase family 4 protein [Chloroflexi bacterium]|nr:glycosyltransferase family 4 protein [Chloroflexota bacterium]